MSHEDATNTLRGGAVLNEDTRRRPEDVRASVQRTVPDLPLGTQEAIRGPRYTGVLRNLTDPPRLRVSAVSFLNTTPLVWGMLHGPQKGLT